MNGVRFPREISRDNPYRHHYVTLELTKEDWFATLPIETQKHCMAFYPTLCLLETVASREMQLWRTILDLCYDAKTGEPTPVSIAKLLAKDIGARKRTK